MSNLRLLRKAQGFTLDELARRAKSERTRLSRYERGYARLNPDELKRVARVLRVKVGAIARNDQVG